MIFRIADISDVPALAAMRWSFRGEAGEAPIESQDSFARRYGDFVRTAMQSGVTIYWIAENESRLIVSHMAVCVVRSIPRPSRAIDQWGYLTDCYTLPAYRDQGVGSELLAQASKWAGEHDLEMLLVWPSDRSQDFYARAGFRREEEVRVLHLREYDAPHLR